MSEVSFAVGGHVNMMMDVLIAQLPPDDLRHACRRLLSEEPSIASELRGIVHDHRLASPLTLPEPSTLFPSSDAVTPELRRYLQDFRLDFLAGLHLRALERINWLVHALWTAGRDQMLKAGKAVHGVLEQTQGDIIQCMQAIKEAHPTTDVHSTALKDALHELWSKLGDVDPSFGFERARYQIQDTYLLLFPDGSMPHDLPSQLVKLKLNAQDIESTIPSISVGPIALPRLLIGLWQLSSPAWGTASATDMQSSLFDLASHGFRAVDMADHYGDAEIIFGQFRKSLPDEINAEMLTCTKWCVFAAPDGPPTPEWVASMVAERRDRCGGYLDVLQFHWQDYSDKRYLAIIDHLVALSLAEPQKVKAIGLVNFDAKRTDEICAYLKRDANDGSGTVISNQVQYSLVDQRPRFRLADVCKKHDIKLLTYGTYCGGFLSDKWLGKPQPNLYAGSITPSQRKYFDMIVLWGGWELFQELLAVLRGIADAHGGGIDIANVAAKWVLEKEEVASVIVGTRLGVSSNTESNLRIFSFNLTDSDQAAINKISVKSKMESMFLKMGDCGAEYRHVSH